MRHFALGGVVGLALVVVNILLVAALVRWWSRPRWRWAPLIALGLGLGAQCIVVGWIASQGLWRLSPWMQESIQFPPLETTLVTAAMTFLAAVAFSWRVLAKSPPIDRVSQRSHSPLYWHQHWLGCFLFGIVVAIQWVISIAMFAIGVRAGGGSFDWVVLAFAVTYRPAGYIWLAAVIGGFALAWAHWRNRKQPLEVLLPRIDPVLFVVLLASLLIAVVASAPIIAAVSFSYWFVYASMI